MVEEAGLETDGMAETTSQLQAKLKALTDGKVDIMVDANSFKNTTEILREMSNEWENMTDVERAAALELLGGKRQANILSALIQNFDTVESVIETSANSAGSALKENERYMDSIQGKIYQFTNSLQTFWNNLLDDELIKFIVSLGTKILELASNFGELNVVVFGFITYLGMTKKLDFSALFGDTKAIKNTLKELEDTYTSAKEKFNSSPTDKNREKMENAEKKLEAFKKNNEPILKRDELNEQLEKLKAERAQLQEDLNVAKADLDDIVTNGVQQDLQDYVEIDTSHIDDAIDAVQEKLDIAKKELADAEAADWDYYKSMGSQTPAKDRDNRIDEARKEVEGYAKELDELQKKKDEFVSSEIDAIFTDEATKNINDVTKKMDDVDDAIQKTEVALKKVEIQAGSTGTAGLTAGQKIKFGFKTAGKQIVKFGKEMLKSMAYAAAISAILESLSNVGDLIKYAWDAIKPKSAEDLQEELEQTTNELSDIESEIRNLNSELDDTNERIEELMSQGTLSYVEQEELENLRAATKELEAQIAFQKTLKNSKQISTNKQAIVATDAYLDTSFTSEQTKTEKQEKWGENGKKIGQLVGTALGALGFIGGPLLGASLMAAGSAIGSTVGGWIGEAAAGASYDAEETVEEAMDNMIATREKLKKNQNDALAEEDSEAYNEATKALATYDKQMAQHISQIQENYNAMDWDTATTEQKNQMIEYADWLRKYNISMGTDGAKSNAIASMFGEEASDEVKALKKDIEDAMSAAKESGVKPNFDFQEAFNSDKLAEFKRRLYDMGLTVTDVEYYFLDLAKAEAKAEDSYSTYDTVKEINVLSDGVNGLKDAFGELTENGYVSMNTLVSLEETFGGLGTAWENFVDVVATGSGTIEQATESINELLEAYLMAQLNKGPMGIEEKLKTILLLQQLGVKNAKEYVDAMQKASVASSVAQSIVSDDKKELELNEKIKSEKATEEEKSEYNELAAKTQAEYIKQFEQQYNIDLTPEEERLLIEKAITAEKAKQAAIEAKTKEDEYISAVKNQKIAQEKLDDYYLERERRAKDAGYDNFDEMLNANDTFRLGTFTVDGLEVGWEDAEAMLMDNVNSVEIPAKVSADNAEEQAKKAEKEYQDACDELGITIDVQLGDFNSDIDNIQSAYDSLTEAVKEYNEKGFLSLDNLQALLSLEPEYLACLQMENGQLSINQAALEAMIQAKLAEAKATVVQSAIHQLDALAAREEANAINESSTASSNAISGLGAYAEALGVVAQDAIVAAGSVAAFNAAVEGAKANELVDQSEIDTILSNMNTQLEMIDAVGANLSANFDSIVSPSSSDSSSEEDDALEKLREKYERKISNLENQQTYLQNEIDRLEAEDEVVSKSYYEEQIMLEQKKIALYQEELAALKQLEMTDEVADALWEVEHAIQESTMRMVEFRQSIIDLYVEAFDGIIEAYDNKDDFLSDQQNYIDKYRELMELQGEVPTAYGYQEQIANEEQKMADNIAELRALRASLAEAMANSDLKEGDDEWIEMQDKIRDCEAAILDNKIALEEYREEMKKLSVDAFELVRNAFSYKDDFLTTQQDYVEGYADYLEALNIDVPEEVYDKLIEIEQQKRENNVTDLVSAREQFAEIEAAGYTAADEEWQDAYSTITDLEKKIQDSDIAMAEWAKTIRDMDFEKFDRFIERLNDIESELENLRGLYDDDDVAFEDGTWTEEGITSLGLAYHQMELAKQKSQEYAKEIEELNEAYNNGEMSEQEYYERLKELKDGQWDAINAYEDAKDAIVDLEEARIDMIEEGINEEIEAYEELIQLKKDELEAERDLFEFKQNVEKQTKDIATLERRIASLSGSTSASDVAERRRLEAELREAQEGLNDTYYGHAKDQQGQALDDELEAYQKTKEDYLEMLRDALEDTEAIINEKIEELLLNADVVLNTINKTAGEYGITLSGSLTLPWQNASTVALEFKQTLEDNLPLLINEDGVVTLFSNDAKAKLENVFTTGGAAAQVFNTTVGTVISNVRTVVENATSPLTAKLRYPWENLTSEDSPINTFSTKATNAINTALRTAQNNAASMRNALTSPWTAGVEAANTFSARTNTALNNALAKARSTAAQISAEMQLAYASYEGNGSSNNNGNNNNNNNNNNVNNGTTRKYAGAAIAELRLDNGTLIVKQAQTTKQYSTSAEAQTAAKEAALNQIRNSKDYIYYFPNAAEANKNWSKFKSKVKFRGVSVFAKGTMGTKKDEWAITDEPWLGNELTMYATKQGTLSYMRAGSTVVPADLTKELIEIGEIGVDGLTAPKFNSGIGLVSNYISKPEINLSFDALVKAEKITEDTLPEVKKFVKQEINSLVKQMNYALKGVGSR